MNNINTLSKKDVRQDEGFPRLIHENSPANILKSARESLKNLDSNKPFRTNKRPHPQLKLPQTSSCLEEVSTAKLRPSVNPEQVEIPDRLRAKSAFDSRMSHLTGNFYKDNQEQTKKFTFDPMKEKKPSRLTIDINVANTGDNTEQKTPKLFIIKHKKNGSRKESLDNDSTRPTLSAYSPTSSKMGHLPQRYSSFKTNTIDLQGSTIEEKKSESFSDAMKSSMTSVSSRNGESRGNSRPLSKFASRAGSRISSRADIQGRDSEGVEDKEDKPNDKQGEEPLEESKGKRNSIILKKDDQIEFNVKLGEVLGEGAYGVVYKAYNLDTGQFLAAKHIKLAELQNKSSIGLENFCHEIEVYQKLEHKNIVPYLGAKQEDEDLYIYMEYMPGGSISSMLKQYGAFQESVIRKFTGQVVQGLHYLHQKGVIHRDIKGGNILSDGSGNVKLADFGASKHIENVSLIASVTSSEVCNSVKGSLFWMAPELMSNEKHGRKIDIWSLGCTVIEMASGKHPWPDVKGFPELIVAVMTKKCPPIPEHLSDTAKDFIKQCCQFDKKLRPRTDKLLLHPFLAGHA